MAEENQGEGLGGDLREEEIATIFDGSCEFGRYQILANQDGEFIVMHLGERAWFQVLTKDGLPMEWLIAQAHLAGCISGRRSALDAIDTNHGIPFGQEILSAIHRALKLVPDGWDSGAVQLIGFVGDMLMAFDPTIQPEDLRQGVDPDGLRITLEVRLPNVQAALDGATDVNGLGEALASMICNTSGAMLVDTIANGIKAGYLDAPEWMTEPMVVTIHHAVSSMAKYDREHRELNGDAENATAVIGKFQVKGIEIDAEKLGGLHETLKTMFLERRTNGPTRTAIDTRMAQPAHPDFGNCPADRAFGELLVGAFFDAGAQFEGKVWWR